MKNAERRARVALVGGPDVDARLDLMRELSGEFELSAFGTDPAVAVRLAPTGFPYHRYPMGRGVDPIGDVRAVISLRRQFRALAPDVVHTFDTKPGVWGRLAALGVGVPVVIGTLPGLGSLYADHSLTSRLLRRIYQPLQRLACHRATCTIFQNDDDREEFVARRVVPSDRAMVIRGSGVRPELYQRSRHAASLPAIRAELGLAPGALVVTMVARVIRTKGVLEYAEAARLVRSRAPETVFLLVGAADDTAGLDRLSQSELDGVRAGVSWLGPRDDVPAILALSDLFVLPSFYREGVPRVLLEAAATGLPLIAARAPGSSDVVRDGWNGLLVPPRDPLALAQAVTQLLEDPARRALWGGRSLEHVVREFSLAVVAGKLRETYRSLLGAARVGPKGER